MKYCILRDDYDLKVHGIIAIPHDVEIEKVQRRIYEIRDEYCYDGNGFTEDGVHWFDKAKEIIEYEFLVEVLDLDHDIYF